MKAAFFIGVLCVLGGVLHAADELKIGFGDGEGEFVVLGRRENVNFQINSLDGKIFLSVSPTKEGAKKLTPFLKKKNDSGIYWLKFRDVVLSESMMLFEYDGGDIVVTTKYNKTSWTELFSGHGDVPALESPAPSSVASPRR